LRNPEEAETVRFIYRRYLELGCLSKLRRELSQAGIISKKRATQCGKRSTGGRPFARNSLYYVLKKRVYLGQVAHKGQVYAGEQEAILEPEVFERVQRQLSTNQAQTGSPQLRGDALLAGLVFDDRGNRMSPGWTKKRGARYRYYISQALLQGERDRAGSRPRVAALDPELRVTSHVLALVGSDCQSAEMTPDERSLIRNCISRVVICATHAELTMDVSQAGQQHSSQLADGSVEAAAQTVSVPLPGTRTRRVWVKLPGIGESGSRTDEALVRAIARARAWVQGLTNGQYSSFRELAEAVELNELYIRRMVRLAWLAQELVQSIAEGRHPPGLTLLKLLQPLPLDWQDQKRVLEFPA
jgi:site-specific DNA recombinase